MKKFLPLMLFVAALAGCGIVRIENSGERSGPSRGSAHGAGEEKVKEPDYSAAESKISAAEATLAKDPAAAEKGFLEGRDALFHAFAASENYPGHLLSAFGMVIDSYFPFGPKANELLWRTVLGRTAALKALHREDEAIAEVPNWETGDSSSRSASSLERRVTRAGDACPASLGTACAEHYAWLQSRFPELTKDENGYSYKVDLNLDQKEGENLLRELPKRVKTLPDKNIVIRIALSGSERAKDGMVLYRDGEEMAFTSGQETGRVKVGVENDHLVVEKERINIEHETVHSNSVSVHLPKELAWSDVHNREIYVFANLRRARATHEGPRTRYHLDKPILIGFSDLYQYGLDLDWVRQMIKGR